MPIKEFFLSFKNAGRGVCIAARGRNMKVELFAAAWALLLVWTGKGSAMQWAAVIAACTLVLGAECLNTAIEKLCDRVSGETEDIIRDIKDIAAGAVLVCAVAAVGIAVAVFANAEFWKTVFYTVTTDGHGWAAAMLVILFAAAIIMIFPAKKGERPDVQYYPYIEGKDTNKDGNN